MCELLLIAALFCGQDIGADTFGVHTFSKHGTEQFRRNYHDGSVTYHDYNNTNFGLYYIERRGFTIGAYRNSYWRNTVYAGWTWEGPTFGPVHTSLSAAFATGYSNRAGTGILRPIALPGARVDVLGVGVKLSGLPVGKESAFVHLSIEKKF